MNSFLHQNWFKILLSVCIVSVSAAAIWYFVKTPDKDNLDQESNIVNNVVVEPIINNNDEEDSERIKSIQNELEQQRQEIEQQRIEAENYRQMQIREQNAEKNCIANGGRYGGGTLCLYY